MAKTRSYKLLCPIARALDRIGDRWTLLILRDLLAGPARFSELQRGLTGIAANLLTDRLAKLTRDGLVTQQDGAHGVTLYALTELGERTSDIIFELAMFGAGFAPEVEVVTPGNLRTVAATFGAAAKRVVTPSMFLKAVIIVDGEPMSLSVGNGAATMRYGEAQPADVTFTTSYAALMALTDGELTPEDFQRDHSSVEATSPAAASAFAELMGEIIALMRR